MHAEHIFVGGEGRLFMVFNTNFNNISIISWRSVLLLGETGVPGENHRPVAIFIIKLYIEYTSSLAGFELTTLMVICTDCVGSCKSNYHTTMTAHFGSIYKWFIKCQFLNCLTSLKNVNIINTL